MEQRLHGCRYPGARNSVDRECATAGGPWVLVMAGVALAAACGRLRGAPRAGGAAHVLRASDDARWTLAEHHQRHSAGFAGLHLARDGKRARPLRRRFDSRVSPCARQRTRSCQRLHLVDGGGRARATCGWQRTAAASRAGTGARSNFSCSGTMRTIHAPWRAMRYALCSSTPKGASGPVPWIKASTCSIRRPAMFATSAIATQTHVLWPPTPYMRLYADRRRQDLGRHRRGLEPL